MEAKKTVLIVEDEKNIVDILRFNLQREGYETLEAYDGESGLELAKQILRLAGENVPVQEIARRLSATEEEVRQILN